MQNLDEIFEEVQSIESTIQKAIGEKSALTRQLEQYKSDLDKDESECIEKFGCSLKELSAKKEAIESEILTLFNDLKEKVAYIE